MILRELGDDAAAIQACAGRVTTAEQHDDFIALNVHAMPADAD